VRGLLPDWFAQWQRFFLTDGSALWLFYLDDRRSYDLELFTTETLESRDFQTLILRVSEKISAQCKRSRSAPNSHRFKLTRGHDREIIDVVVDRAPQVDALKASGDGIRVQTLREILVIRLTTLVNPSGSTDLVDRYFFGDVRMQPACGDPGSEGQGRWLGACRGFDATKLSACCGTA
jgi:hypothetical protein